MQLATLLRAPFIAPGRRNRKVHWNRPLSRAIAMLGKYEQEDLRRAMWLPESLRGFYPKCNNQFSPGGGSDCGCCVTTTPDPCTGIEDCFGGSLLIEAEVDVPEFAATDGDCANCNLVEGTYILTPFASSALSQTLSYLDSPNSAPCGTSSTFSVSLGFSCGGTFSDGFCHVSGTVVLNRAAIEIQYSYFNEAGSTGTFFNFSSLPWALPYLGEFAPGTDVNCTPNGDPMIVQSLTT